MAERALTISNKLGLHARAAAKLVQLCGRYQAQVYLTAKGREVNAKSILGVMMLAAGIGTPVRIRAEGPDAEAAVEAVAALIERKFDEGQ